VPDQKIPASSAVGASLIDNPDYTSWYNKDQQVLSGLLSSMSEEILHDVVSTKTSKDVWDSLLKRFSSTTRVCTVQLRVELATTQKSSLSVTDYFGKIKNLATEMAAAHAALRDDEILAYLLAGLPVE
jgi:glycosylphosphatidylinositol transamidase (GPIT) subunit GPI8